VAINGRREAGLAGAIWLVISCKTRGFTVFTEVVLPAGRLLIFDGMMDLKFAEIERCTGVKWCGLP